MSEEPSRNLNAWEANDPSNKLSHEKITLPAASATAKKLWWLACVSTCVMLTLYIPALVGGSFNEAETGNPLMLMGGLLVLLWIARRPPRHKRFWDEKLPENWQEKVEYERRSDAVYVTIFSLAFTLMSAFRLLFGKEVLGAVWLFLLVIAMGWSAVLLYKRKYPEPQ
ncbi:MAG: hypothetical protein Q3974_00285 [Rothia sp. (in: high G+C Gram-positive bacteria)]|nr:hypothetical protein [Rothia sp. (in: high G+C Gram-positive bacteria)]